MQKQNKKIIKANYKSKKHTILLGIERLHLHSSCFSGDVAGLLELYGRLIPSASIAVAIVFAVYIPPHAPGPGQAKRTISSRVESSIAPIKKNLL